MKNIAAIVDKLPPQLQPDIRICEGRKVYFFTPQQLEMVRDMGRTQDYGSGSHPLSGNYQPHKIQNNTKPTTD
jgi:hypothetical protein